MERQAERGNVCQAPRQHPACPFCVAGLQISAKRYVLRLLRTPEAPLFYTCFRAA
jgi:hypothetical protein